MQNIQDMLRNLKVLEGPFSHFNTHGAPEKPHELFLDWLSAAIEKGVPEPHAMTLSTIASDGHPDARTLILKDLDQSGWYFASSSESKKGQQMKNHSNVALTFYWPLVGRQVRIRGTVTELGSNASKKDFLARNETARAAALIGKQSDPLFHVEDLEEALSEQLKKLEKEPTLVYPQWMLYLAKAEEVEFWQGDQGRKHTRLLYYLDGGHWQRQLLWP